MGLFDKKSHKEEPALKKKIKNSAPAFKNAKEENRRNLGIFQIFNPPLLIFNLDILEQVNRNGGSNKVAR